MWKSVDFLYPQSVIHRPPEFEAFEFGSDRMKSSNGCSVEINLNNSFKDGAKFTTFPAGILDQHKSENVITCIKAHNINSFEVVFASATTDYQKKK